MFMNPPYGRQIGKWVQKAWEESQKAGTVVVCLLPARTDTAWFHDYCRKGEVRFIRGRLRFGDAKNTAPFPSMVVIFGERKKRHAGGIEMNDLISRQAAIDGKIHIQLANGVEIYSADAVLVDYLKALPSAQPEQQWIPCSERLPEPNEEVDHLWRYYLVQNEYGDMMVATYRGNRKGESWWEQMYVYRPTEDAIVAWMPLPDPYMPERSEDGVESDKKASNG